MIKLCNGSVLIFNGQDEVKTLKLSGDPLVGSPRSILIYEYEGRIEVVKVSQDDFREYEKVRSEGEINMMDTKGIMSRTCLSSEQISDIRQNYSKYDKKWGN